VKRPPNRAERKEISMFSIWTPLPEDKRPPTAEDAQTPPEADGDAEPVDSLPPMTKD